MVELLLGCIACTVFISWVFLKISQMRKVSNYLRQQQSSHETIHHETPLTVLICVKGDAPFLPKYLEKILIQRYTEFEVLIVYFNICEIVLRELNSLKGTHSNLRVLELPPDSPFTFKKQALNFGIENSRYEWIVTTDDDCYPDSDLWLKSIANAITEKKDIVLGLSPFVSYRGLLDKWIRYDWLMGNSNMIHMAAIQDPCIGMGRNMAFSKKLWNSEYLNKYASLGHGDDTTLVLTFPTQVDIQLESKVYTQPKRKISAWLVQKSRHISAGHFLTFRQRFELAKLPLISILFWISMWLWMSYFHVQLITLCILVAYISAQLLLHYFLERQLGVKKKIFYMTPILDGVHSIFILTAPFFLKFISAKWKE